MFGLRDIGGGGGGDLGLGKWTSQNTEQSIAKINLYPMSDSHCVSGVCLTEDTYFIKSRLCSMYIYALLNVY